MITVNKKVGIYQPEPMEIRVQSRFGKVYVLVNDAKIEFNVPTAFKLGMSIVRKAGELQPNEYLAIKINGGELNLLQDHALQVGGAILRKCDFADDFQKQRLIS